jgi:D-3-phosphoglycerate dehydrogenase
MPRTNAVTTDALRTVDLKGRPARTLVLDVDSTLCGIEAFGWLAERRGDLVSRRVADLSRRAANGSVPLQQIYGLRLTELRPRRAELDLLARAYVDAIAPATADAMCRIRRAGVQVVLLSNAPRHSLLRLALHLELGADELHAVHVGFDAVGAYTGYDAESVLTMAGGKRKLVADLALEGPVVAVGGTVSDLEMRDAVDMFIAYTGFVTNADVVARADAAAASFADIERVVLS